MTITEMSYRSAQTSELEAALDELMNMPASEVTEADEYFADLITDELYERDLEANLPGAYDSPSLADEGIEIGSYAS